MKLVVLSVSLALAVAGCKDEPKKSIGGTAQGEVLPGTVSDEMLPLDSVKSQPPLAPKVEGGTKSDAKDDKPAAKPKSGSSAAAQPDEAEPAAEQEPAAED